MRANKITNIFLFIGFVLCALQIWWPEYYLTGDGPCHVYNAQVLHDLWCHKNTLFYGRFYDIIAQPNPNWLSTIVMALLLFLVNGVIAEKIFLTLYVVLYLTGGLLLLRRIGGRNSYWQLVIFIFIFTHPLAKGFYNFSFSIAFYFWMVWSWLRFLERKTLAGALFFFMFACLAFFTHLLAFVFGSFTAAALVLSFAIAEAPGNVRQKFMGYFLPYIGLLALLLAPLAMLMKWFTEKEGGMQIQIQHHFSRIYDLVRFRYIVDVVHQEEYFAEIAGVGLLLLFFFGFTRFWKGIRINKYDGLLISFLFVLFVYLFFPEDFLGRLILISMRVQLYVFVIIACCIAYMLPSEKIKNVGAVVLFLCFIALNTVRLSCQLSASAGVARYVSAAQYIRPYSVVLPLDFSPNGKNENGKMIADRNWLFCHSAQYLGLKKPLIVLDNYEANMGYFPLLWKEKVNPYLHLSKNGGIEGLPPYALIDDYRQNAGVTVDYILMWCYDPSFLTNNDFSKLYKEINDGYHSVYNTPDRRIILYEKNHNIQ